MEVLEVEIDQNRVVTFDGRVLEVFGGSVRRFHVKLRTVTVSAPDKKGNRNVTLKQAGIDNAVRSTRPSPNGFDRCSTP